MNNETFNHDYQEVAEPTDYDRLGEEVEFAGDQPEQPEQPKQFGDLSPEEIPDGVRDEQDYQEYQAEQSAREQERIDSNLNLSINFLDNNYCVHNKNLQEGGEFAERYQEFLNSPDLVTLAKNDITIGGLYAAGLLKRSGEGTVGDIFGPSGVAEVVDEIAILFNDEPVSDSGKTYSDAERAKFITIYNKLKNRQKLNLDDYIFVDIDLSRNLADLIEFGLPDKDGDEKTLNYIQEGTQSFYLDVTYIMDKLDDGLIANEGHVVSEALGELCRNNLDNLYEEMEAANRRDYDKERFNDLKELLLRSFTSTDIKFEHDHLSKLGISDKEVLESVYCFEKTFGDGVSLAPWRDPLYKLAREQGSLEANGFSRDSIINVLHDNEVSLAMEEIRDMREAGVSDADIIYAGKFYEDYCPEIGDMRDEKAWGNRGAFEANFSERDMLIATRREIYYQERQNQSR